MKNKVAPFQFIIDKNVGDEYCDDQSRKDFFRPVFCVKYTLYLSTTAPGCKTSGRWNAFGKIGSD